MSACRAATQVLPSCPPLRPPLPLVSRVQEDTPTKWTGTDGEDIIIPVKYEDPNPNGFEVDCLYRASGVDGAIDGAPCSWASCFHTVDMNGIVHPCTHPEGKPAPETEEDMMVEVFKYTERVVNMARPRKLLMMAIGVWCDCALYTTTLTAWSLAPLGPRRRRRPTRQDEPAALAPIPRGPRSRRKRGRARRGDPAVRRDGPPRVGRDAQQEELGLERHHARDAVHGPPRGESALLGQPQAEHGSGVERCASAGRAEGRIGRDAWADAVCSDRNRSR